MADKVPHGFGGRRCAGIPLPNLLDHLAMPGSSRLKNQWDRCGVYHVNPMEGRERQGGEIEICLETRFFGYLFFLVCCWESMRSLASKLTLQSILRSEPRMGSLGRKWRVVCWIRRDCRL